MEPHADAGRAVRDALSQDLRRAQQGRDLGLMRTYRALLAAIDNAGAVAAPQQVDYSQPDIGSTEAPRRQLDAAAVQGLFEAEVQEREGAAAQYRSLGADAVAEQLEAECLVIRRYLDVIVPRSR